MLRFKRNLAGKNAHKSLIFLEFRQVGHAEICDSVIQEKRRKQLFMREATESDLRDVLFVESEAIGHILLTKVRLKNIEETVSGVILAPLAVVPEVQKQGIGGKLIYRGLDLLSEAGTDLVFVLGHPEYYPRFGFKPAGHLGFEAPYPIPDKHADAWMVQALRPGLIGSISGKVVCANALNKPEHWRE